MYRNQALRAGNAPLFSAVSLTPSSAALLTGRALLGDFDADGRPDVVDMDYWNLGNTSFGYPTLGLSVRWNDSTPGNLSFASPQPWLPRTCAPAGPVPGTALTAKCFTGGFGSPATTNCTQCDAESILASAGVPSTATTVVVPPKTAQPARGRFGINRSGTGSYGLENFVLDLDGDGVQEVVFRDAIEDQHEFRDGADSQVTPNPPAGLLSRVIQSARHVGGRTFTTQEVVRIPGSSSIDQSIVTDFNGDGAPDLLVISAAGAASIRMNDGRGKWGGPLTIPGIRPRVRVADFDADGRAEVLDLTSGKFWKVDIFRGGSGFPNQAFTTDFGDDPDRNLVVADLDTDTLMDFVFVRGSRLLARFHTGRRPGLVDEIRQERRAESFGYAALGGGADYASAPLCVGGQSCVKSGMFVVDTHSYTSIDPLVSGRVLLNRSHYAYRDGRVDVAGGGWLGFGLVSKREDHTGAVEEFAYGVALTDRLVCGEPNCAGRFTYPFAMRPRRVTHCLDLRETSAEQGRALQFDTFTAQNQRWVETSTGNFMLRTLSTQIDQTEYDGPQPMGRALACLGVPLPLGRQSPVRSSRQIVDVEQGVVSRSKTATWIGGFLGGFGQPLTLPPNPQGGVISTTTSAELYPSDANHWLFGLTRTLTTTSVQPGEPTVSRTVDYEYEPFSSLLKAEISMKGVAAADSEFELRREYSRDAFGNITRIEAVASAARRRVEFDFDPAEHLFPVRKRSFPVVPATAARPALELQQYYELSHGLLAASDDVNGVRTLRTYDSFARLRAEIDPRVPSTKFSYRDNGGMFEVVRSELMMRSATRSSNLWRGTARLDMFGRIIRETELGWRGRSVVRTTSYDRNGRPQDQSLPFFEGERSSLIVNSFDKAGRRIAVRNEATEDTVSTYFEGLVERVVDARGFESRVTHDALGRPILTSNLDGQREVRTSLGYGAFGNLVRVTDARRGRVIAWDALGRRTSIEDPDSGTERAHYNAFGEATWVQDPRSAIVETAYDGLGRPMARSLTSVGTAAPGLVSNSETFEWDTAPHGKGQLARSTSMDGVVTDNTYTGLGQPFATTWSIPTRGDYRFIRSYDANGRLSQVEYPDGFKASYTFDDSGPVANIFDLTSQNSRVFHVESVNAAGGILTEQFGNDAVTTRVFDDAYRLTYQETSDSVAGGTANSPTVFQRLKYDYGRGSFLKARHDPTKQLSEYFDHDFLGRLTNWRVIQTTGSTCRGGVTTYAYDDVGNLLSRTVVGSGLSVVNTYGALPNVPAKPNALSSTTEGQAATSYFAYDEAGNQERAFVHRPPVSATDSGDKQFVWTHFNLPRTLTDTAQGLTTSFSYDAMHSRVLRTSSAETVLSLAGLYEERKMGASNTIRIRNLVAAGRIVAQLSASSATQQTAAYLHSDLLGSPDAVTAGGAAQSSLLQRAKYEPFGERRDENDVAQPSPIAHQLSVGFTGHEPDDFFGLTNMRGRLYDQRTGRFVSADPFVGSVVFGQALNRYSYVLNSPLALTDPSGHFYEVVLGITFTSAWLLALFVGSVIAAAGGILAGLVSAIAGAVSYSVFGATPSGSPDAGRRVADDAGSSSQNPTISVSCKAGMCHGAASDAPLFKFSWKEGTGDERERGVNDFRLAVSAIRRQVTAFPQRGTTLQEMHDGGADIEVRLRMPPSEMSGRYAPALGQAQSSYRGFPHSMILMQKSEAIDRSTGVTATWNGSYGDTPFRVGPKNDMSFEATLMHEIGHTVGAYQNGGWAWDGVGYDGSLGGVSPDNPVLQEAIRWDREARRLWNMEPLPINAVHPQEQY